MYQWILIYLAAVNLIALILYGLDKRRARAHVWRIPEKTLIGIALIGGSVGAIAGMLLFRHKTRHWYFRYGLPVILAIQVIAAVWAYRRFMN